MYRITQRGEQFGPFGERKPMKEPIGNGYFQCGEDDPPPPGPLYDIVYTGNDVDFRGNHLNITLNYEMAKDHEYEADILGNDCAANVTGLDIDLTSTRSPQSDTQDVVNLRYSLHKSELSESNIWNATGNLEFCHRMRIIFPAFDAYPKMVVTEDRQNLEIYSTGN